MKRFFRILPVTIFVAMLMLSAKLGGIWSGVTGTPPAGAGIEVARSMAQLAPAAGDQATAGDAATPTPDPGPEAAPKESGIMAASPTDPITFSQSEIELLQALATRREQLADREREVELREAMLSAAEKRIEQKIVTLKDVQKRVAALLDQQEASQAKDTERLVKVYENMKPKAAARIFEKMEKPVLLRVAARMKEAKLAPILAQMDPAKVTVVSAELMRRHQMPRPPGPLSGS